MVAFQRNHKNASGLQQTLLQKIQAGELRLHLLKSQSDFPELGNFASGVCCEGKFSGTPQEPAFLSDSERHGLFEDWIHASRSIRSSQWLICAEPQGETEHPIKMKKVKKSQWWRRRRIWEPPRSAKENTCI